MAKAFFQNWVKRTVIGLRTLPYTLFSHTVCEPGVERENPPLNGIVPDNNPPVFPKGGPVCIQGQLLIRILNKRFHLAT